MYADTILVGIIQLAIDTFHNCYSIPYARLKNIYREIWNDIN